MDKNDIPINIYLDISKAFDTLDHTILLEKLNYYGINGVALKLMESYLTNCTQYVEINNVKSDTLKMMTGVPQGSILGPLFFIIYINDIAQASKLFDFIIYADDTLEIIIRNTPNLNADKILNTEFKNMNDWLKLNKLSLNLKKCKYMIFHTHRKK